MQHLGDFLDALNDRIRRGEGEFVVSELCDYLSSKRTEMHPEDWQTDIVDVCRQHPIHAALLEDPYTKRAFEKPRGYGGDAVMLDFVYSGEPLTGTTAIGRSIFNGTTRLSNGRSVVARRDLLAAKIDDICSRRPATRVLSIACGHLREAEQSQSLASKNVQEFIAFDQDDESLSFVRKNYSPLGVRTICGSVVEILRGKVSFEGLDFVYAAGLFDYLPDSLGRRLLSRMTYMVRPGGRVLIANFTPDNHGRGYMECFMDWFLICRDENEMLALLKNVDGAMLANQDLYRDEFGNIVYLELERS